MTPEQLQAYYTRMGIRPPLSEEQLRRQSVIRTGAGLADILSSRGAQRAAEEQIEGLGAEQEALTQQFKDLSAPSLTDANTIAAATRNAAILGGVPQQQDQSAELAAAKMAMESGADPATVQRQLAQAQQAEQQAAASQQQQAFQQGLGMAQADAQNQFAQQQQALMMDMDANAQALEAAQRESLMAQQQKQRGVQGAVTGLTQFAQNFDKSLGGEDASFLKTLGSNIFGGQQASNDPAKSAAELGLTMIQEQGGSVQKTPGEYDHDTNDMILMAQDEGGKLVDTGIRQTGGEYVIDPFDAGNMRQAHENIDPVKLEKVRKGQASLDKKLAEDLMRLYDAVRFVKEPQFQDDYEA
jgi:hypothetical protein